MKWVSDIDRTVLVSNFERLGWVRGSTEGHEGTSIFSGFHQNIVRSIIHKLQHYVMALL